MNSKAGNLAAAILAVFALVALVAFVKRGCGGPRAGEAATSTDFAVASRLARAVSEDQQPGKIVLVRPRGFLPGTDAVQDAQERGFKHGLQGAGWDVVKVPPSDMDEAEHNAWVMRTYGDAWGNDLLSWLGSHQDAVAVVSLAGVPTLPRRAWKDVPPFYAQRPAAQDRDLALLRSGEVKGLAVMLLDADPTEADAFRGSPEELFDLVYEYRAAP